MLLFVFNLMPFPPLDGSRILRHFLPYNALQVYDRMGMFGMDIHHVDGGGLIFRIVSLSAAVDLRQHPRGTLDRPLSRIIFI